MPDKPSWVLYRLPKKAKYNDVMQVHYLRKCRPPLIPLVTTINRLPLRRSLIAPPVVSMSRKQKMASEPQAAFDDYVWGTETRWFLFSLHIRLIWNSLLVWMNQTFEDLQDCMRWPLPTHSQSQNLTQAQQTMSLWDCYHYR